MIYQPIEYTGEYTIGTIYSEEYVKKLEQQLQQKENIIKEVREKLNFIGEYISQDERIQMCQLLQNHREVLEILDKGE